MAAHPPRPPREPGDGPGGSGDEPRPGRGAGWQPQCALAWRRLRALPGWMQLLLWLTLWPVVAALHVAGSRRLGPLAAPLTVAVLLVGGLGWWSALAEDGLPGGAGADDPSRHRTLAPGGAFGTVAFAGVAPTAAAPPEFDPATLGIEIVECVQTRSRSAVHEGPIRQPRVVVRLANHGPERTVRLQGAVLLEGYDWNGGWKPTAEIDVELGPGQMAETTLLTDYRHQSAYSPDGLYACRLIDLQVVAPQVWPDYPARQALPVDAPTAAAEGERDFDPQRDLTRTDTR